MSDTPHTDRAYALADRLLDEFSASADSLEGVRTLLAIAYMYGTDNGAKHTITLLEEVAAEFSVKA
jgi:hypothetical protein